MHSSDVPYDKVNDAENWDWDTYPAGWYETVGFIGPEIGSWSRYIQADREAQERVQINKRL